MSSRVKGYLSVGLVCFVYWILDSIWSYVSFEYNLKKLIYSEPGSYLDTFLLKVPPYQIVSRLMVIVLFIVLGALVIEFIIRRQEADKQIRESEEKFKTLFNHSNDGILLADAESKKIEMCNPKICEMLGYSPDEFIRLSIHDIHPEKDLPNVLDAFEMQLKKKIQSIEFPVLRRDNSIFYAAISSSPMELNGKSYLLGTFRDETERKKAQEELARSERKWKDILVNTPQIGISINPRAEITFANRHFLNLTGWQEHEVIGQNWFDMFIPETKREEIGTVFQSVMKKKDTREFSNYENDILTRSGELINVAWFNVLTKDGEGNIVDVSCLGIDLTERSKAEKRLKESEEKYRLLVENQTDMVVKVDLEGRFLFVSPSYCRIFGKTEEELLGKTFMPLVHEEDREATARTMEALFSPPYTVYLEQRAMTREGWRWLAWMDTAVFDHEGNIVEIIGAGRDITDKKNAEQERTKIENQLRQSQKMESIGRLAGGVAHDFNNMLSIILGNTEIGLEDLEPSHPVAGNLEEIQKAAERSADLTRQLLAFARKQTVSPKVLDLNQTIERMLEMLKRLIGENIDLSWRPRPSLWPVNIDPSQIDQIMANLCVNARDAIKDIGRVTIETDNVSLDEAYCQNQTGIQPGEYVFIGVSDDGSGMDKTTIANLFEPFFTTKGLGKGTGLGLATVYGIVKQNNGIINVYSEPNQGTTFKIYLPKYQVKFETGPQKSLQKEIQTGDETILLVEDEKAILEMTKQILERMGYRVLAAVTPDEALQMGSRSEQEIHLLLTDVVMPGMNGRDLAEKLLKIRPDMKCLFMSGYTSNVIAHRGILDKGLNFIKKPFTKTELSYKLREVFEKT